MTRGATARTPSSRSWRSAARRCTTPTETPCARSPTSNRRPDPLVRAAAPVRVCDAGGWTDTWFGGPGRVLNVAVSPRVEVAVRPALDAATPGDPLVRAALDTFPAPGPVEVEITSGVPAGSGMGTSAAVGVALCAALCALRGEAAGPLDLARAAHHLEVDVLGQESGVQDQLAAAFGGISFITVDSYPEATVETLPPWPELDEALTTVYLGRPHVSSEVHRSVVEDRNAAAFERLRAAAEAARSAVVAGDLHAFGLSLIRNTDAQRALHPSLVGVAAAAVFELARSEGSLGWKVNGAGGEGGSVSAVFPSAGRRAAFEQRVAAAGGYQVVATRPCREGVTTELTG